LIRNLGAIPAKLMGAITPGSTSRLQLRCEHLFEMNLCRYENQSTIIISNRPLGEWANYKIIIVPRNDEVSQFRNLVHCRDALSGAEPHVCAVGLRGD
jgi:hypothetical protein